MWSYYIYFYEKQPFDLFDTFATALTHASISLFWHHMFISKLQLQIHIYVGKKRFLLFLLLSTSVTQNCAASLLFLMRMKI